MDFSYLYSNNSTGGGDTSDLLLRSIGTPAGPGGVLGWGSSRPRSGRRRSGKEGAP
jgi:hypothetical protein